MGSRHLHHFDVCLFFSCVPASQRVVIQSLLKLGQADNTGDRIHNLLSGEERRQYEEAPSGLSEPTSTTLVPVRH